MLALCLCICLLAAYTPVFAANSTQIIDFSKTNVLDDLLSSKTFDIAEYPYDTSKSVRDCRVFNVVEYCYSPDEENRGNYGVYLYVYNPSGVELNVMDGNTTVSLGVTYNTKPVTANSEVISYERRELMFCSKATGDYANLFYKFKVVDDDLGNRVNPVLRRYDIAGIQLLAKGSTITDIAVSGTYLFTGFAKGFGLDATADSSLNCKVTQLETIELSVENTFWRSKTSDSGRFHQKQIDSVWFSVPNRYFEKYGTLQRIKADWYELRTKWMLVTSNKDFYDAALPYIGIPITKESAAVDDDFLCEYGAYVEAPSMGGGWWRPFAWNACESGLYSKNQEELDSNAMHEYILDPDEWTATLYYLLYTNGESIDTYDPYKKASTSGSISSTDLIKYLLEVCADNTESNDIYPMVDGTRLSSGFFRDDIDPQRKELNASGRGHIQKGYSYYDFDADLDMNSWQSWEDTQTGFWADLFRWLDDDPIEEGRDVAPIMVVDSSVLSGMTTSELANELYMQESDVVRLKADYAEALLKDETIVLFRFAVTDYEAAPVTLRQYDVGLANSDKVIEDEAYVARQTLFLNFDVISLTFQGDGEYTVIPVVADPIDIVDDVTPPSEQPGMSSDETNMLQKIIMLILVIIALIVLMPLIIVLLSLIIKLLTVPLKALGSMTRWMLKRQKKRQKDREKKEDDA